MKHVSIQVQSVLYHNEKPSLYRAVENAANAVRVARQTNDWVGRVRMVYGDASEKPVFSPEEVEALRQTYDGLLECDVVFFQENTGTARGHNLLAKNAQVDYVVLMNPDVVFSPRFFTGLLAPFQNPEDRVGAAEARQTPFEHSKWYNPETGETCWVSGACSLMPMPLFQQLGGYDEESFFMHCDDVDLSWRIRAAGYKTLYVPGVPVLHAKRLSREGKWLPTKAEEYYSAEAALMLSYKWSREDILRRNLNYLLGCPEEAPGRNAAEAFLQRKEEGRLPQQLDPEHTIAAFGDVGYGEYRFMPD